MVVRQPLPCPTALLRTDHFVTEIALPDEDSSPRPERVSARPRARSPDVLRDKALHRGESARLRVRHIRDQLRGLTLMPPELCMGVLRPCTLPNLAEPRYFRNSWTFATRSPASKWAARRPTSARAATRARPLAAAAARAAGRRARPPTPLLRPRARQAGGGGPLRRPPPAATPRGAAHDIASTGAKAPEHRPSIASTSKAAGGRDL